MSALGDPGGIPVIESPRVPPGQAYLLSGPHWDRYVFRPWEPYTAAPDTVRGYVQRQANALRRDLGLAEVDYAAEYERNRLRRLRAFAAENRLALALTSPSALTITAL